MPDAAPGRPFDLQAQFAYPAATDADKDAADRQASGLVAADRDRRSRLQDLHRRLMRRREQLGKTDAYEGQAPLDELVDKVGQPLLVRAELIVRRSDLDGAPPPLGGDSMASILEQRTLSELRAPAPLPDGRVPAGDSAVELTRRIALLTNQTRRPDRLAYAVDQLRRSGYQASVNQVTPLGYVTKADNNGVGAEPTTRRLTRVAATGAEKRSVRVTVIDTGVNADGRDDGWLDGVTGDTDPLYDVPPTDSVPGQLDLSAGHGTFVAGIVRQVAPAADITVIRAIGPDGIGDDVSVAFALLQAFDEGSQIVNLSLGTATPNDAPPLATLVALEIIGEQLAADREREFVVVAAAGNGGSTRPVFPAAFTTMPWVGVPVVSVAGLSRLLGRSAFSSRGLWVTCSAPAEGILSTFVLGRESEDMDPNPDTWEARDPWAVWSGTSFATPQVSGAIARRAQETGGRIGDAMVWLLAQGPKVPDFGTALEILPAS